MINPDNLYDLHWPIRRGGLNLHKAVGGTLSAVLQDLEDIWSTALCTYLKISPDAFKVISVHDFLQALLLQKLSIK